MKAREAGAQSAATTARERNIMVLRLGVDPAFCEDVDFYGLTENLEYVRSRERASRGRPTKCSFVHRST